MSKKKRPQENKTGFTEREWHGKISYKCGLCPWSTLSKEEIESHVTKHRAASAPRAKRIDTGLIGPSGGKIVREEIVEPEPPVAEEESDG